MPGTPVVIAPRADVGTTAAIVTATVNTQTTTGSMLFAAVRSLSGQRVAGVVDSLGRAFTQAAAGGTTSATITLFSLRQDGGTLASGATVATTSALASTQMLVFEVADAANVERTVSAVKTTVDTNPLTIPATAATTTAPQLAVTAAALSGVAVEAPSVTAGWTLLTAPGGTLGNAVAVAWQTVDTAQAVGPVTWTLGGANGRNMAGLTTTWQPPPPPPLEITTTSLPDATVGQPYTATLQASGGVPPYSWAVTAGALPAGLSLDPSTGVISGTPTQPSPT